MKVFGIIGRQNAGKTTLLTRLVGAFAARGISVSTVKHAHHDIDLDTPGKDSYRHRQAGAQEVMLVGPRRLALMREFGDATPGLPEILARFAPVDLVLVEGYKRDRHPRIEVWRAACGQPPLQPGDPLVRAVASDGPVAGVTVPILDLNDPDAIARFILAEIGLAP